MDEQQWLASEDPAAMLTALQPTRSGDASPIQAEGGQGGISDRKLRLFACACCLAAGSSFSVVDEYEQVGYFDDDPGEQVTDSGWATGWTERGLNKPTLPHRAALLRDIVGNPWRPVTLPPLGRACSLCRSKGTVPAGAGAAVQGLPSRLICRRCEGRGQLFHPWLTDTVVRLARHIYAERDWELMPQFGDALEDAGCVNEDVLRHCRGWERHHRCSGTGIIEVAIPGGRTSKVRCETVAQSDYCTSGWIPLRGPHARGCWAIDCILGKS